VVDRGLADVVGLAAALGHDGVGRAGQHDYEEQHRAARDTARPRLVGAAREHEGGLERILFAVATGGVRGFAFMLLLGTAISIFTAVFATRAFLGLLAGFRWFDNPKFMGASAQKMARWQMFDAVGKRRIWFTIAGILIAISIGSLIFKGLNLGIDFRGGTQMTLQTQQPTRC